MQFAPIPPISLISEVVASQPYLMALPSMFLTLDFAADSIFRDARRRGAFVMLDNGLSEFKQPLEGDALAYIASKLNPSELILPDYLEDPARTIQAAKTHIQLFRDGGYDGRFMAVPQGKSPHEYLDCIYELVAIPDIQTIGISKYFRHITGRLRSTLLEAIQERGLHNRRSLDWHLLGLDEPLSTISTIAIAFPWLRGIDTCYPIVAAMHGLEIPQNGLITSPEGFETASIYAYWPFDKMPSALSFWHLLQKNLLTFEKACRGQL